MLPVIFYPYFYVIYLACIFFMSGINENLMDMVLDAVPVIAIIYNGYCLVIVIYNAVCTGRGNMTTKQVAKMNMITKCVQIPAYIMHFVFGVLGFCMGLWGIGLLLWAIFIDLVTICFTGINSIGCTVRMCKDEIFSKCVCVFMGIGSFVYCVDIVIAIVYFVKARKKDY